MKEYSQSKALYHLDRLKELQANRPISPTMIQVDLEAYCNDNCSFCSYRKEDAYNNSMLSLIDAKPGKEYHEDKPIGKPTSQSSWPKEMAEKLPIQMVEARIPAIEITGGGESTLWPYLDELLYNLGKWDRDVALVTNGSNLSDKRIDLICKYCLWVRISMDSSNPMVHKKIHRTSNYDFERRIENIKKLVRYKPPKLVLGISFIINHDNYDDIEASAKYYHRLGVDNIRFSWMYDSSGNSGLTQEQIDNAKSLLSKLQSKLNNDTFGIHYDSDRVDLYTRPNTDFDTCHFQRFVWAIGADMKIYPCCIMKYHPDYAFGSLKEHTLKQLVDKMDNSMTNLLPKQCMPCWLRNKNKAIDNAVKEPLHHNFI